MKVFTSEIASQRPGKATRASTSATSNAGGSATRIAVSETRNDTPMISHSAGSKEASRCSAFPIVAMSSFIDASSWIQESGPPPCGGEREGETAQLAPTALDGSTVSPALAWNSTLPLRRKASIRVCPSSEISHCARVRAPSVLRFL